MIKEARGRGGCHYGRLVNYFGTTEFDNGILNGKESRGSKITNWRSD